MAGTVHGGDDFQRCSNLQFGFNEIFVYLPIDQTIILKDHKGKLKSLPFHVTASFTGSNDVVLEVLDNFQGRA